MTHVFYLSWLEATLVIVRQTSCLVAPCTVQSFLAYHISVAKTTASQLDFVHCCVYLCTLAWASSIFVHCPDEYFIAR